jgi:ribonuclease Z
MFHPSLKSRPDEDIAILISPENHPAQYLCECGQASDLTVKECQNLAALFISHCHIDHFIGFDTILRHQLGIGKKVTILGPKGMAEIVRHKILGYHWNLIEPGSITYEIRELHAPYEFHTYELNPPTWDLQDLGPQKTTIPYQNEAFQVEYCLLDHGTPSVAYLFKAHDKTSIDLTGSGLQPGPWVKQLKEAHAASNHNNPINIQGKETPAHELYPLLSTTPGYRLGVIMDHAATPENHKCITDLFQGADTVFIECFYSDEDADFATRNHHSHASASATVLRQANVKSAIPVHFSRKYTETDRAHIKSQFETAFRAT